MDMGLPIERGTTNWSISRKEGVNKVWSQLKKSQLKIGEEISKDSMGGDLYIITDILGDGKFKATAKTFFTGIENPTEYLNNLRPQLRKRLGETFDISTKTTTQQGIRLTDEIKAKIRGEAPTLKKPSGVLR